jgi:undecaprenyl-diphosphatase
MMTLELITGIWDFLSECDTRLLLVVNGWHSSYWDSFMRLYSTQKLLWIPLYIALCYVIYRNFGWRVLMWTIILECMALLITDTTASHLIKPYVGRLRPAHLDSGIASVVHVVDNHRGGAFSFPSSHSGNIWGLVFLMALLLRHRWITFCLTLWALLMCYSRMYLGLHYPSDLLAGFVLGVTCAWLAWLVLRRVKEAECGTSIERESKSIEGGLIPIYTLGATLFLIVCLSFFVRV